jgi:hypothetical protein
MHSFWILLFKSIFCGCCSNESLVCAVQFAHRACVQRWCNEKGDVTCEICHEVTLCSSEIFMLPPI